MKALEMQKDGGNIVCILNAETLKNPFTNLRKVLKGKLEQYNAAIEYLEEAFLDSEHPTTVEVAVVKVSIPAKSHDSSILESLKSKTYDEGDFCSRNLAVKDLVRSIVKNYEVEVEAGIRLIQEYLAMQPYLMDSLDMDDAYKKPIIRMKIGEKEVEGLFVGHIGIKTACLGKMSIYERPGGYIYLELKDEKEMEEWQATST